MLTIAQHTERLLLHNDCVIIPDFGGFVVQDCCARYVEEEGIFLPPYRGVVFNPRLTSNDGLLVNAVARERNISYHEAAHAVEVETAELRDAIRATGSLVMAGIGTLRAADGGSYEFEPVPCGIATPALHGLDSYYTPLYHAKGDRKLQKDETKTTEQDVLTIRLRLSHLRRVAVVAAVGICCLLAIMTGHLSGRYDQLGEAGMMQQWWEAVTEQMQWKRPQPMILPTTVNENAAQPKAEKPETAPKRTQKAKAEEPAPQKAKAEEPAPQEGYCIVVASAIPLKNAQEMVKDWNGRSMPIVRTLETGNMVRVVSGTFLTEQEAREAMQQYKTAHSEFADAWIYHFSHNVIISR